MTNDESMRAQMLASLDEAINHFKTKHGDGAAITVMRLEDCKDVVARHAPRPPDLAKVREAISKALPRDRFDEIFVRWPVDHAETVDLIFTTIAPFLFAPAQPGPTDAERLLLQSYRCILGKLTDEEARNLGRDLAEWRAAMASGKKEGA